MSRVERCVGRALVPIDRFRMPPWVRGKRVDNCMCPAFWDSFRTLPLPPPPPPGQMACLYLTGVLLRLSHGARRVALHNSRGDIDWEVMHVRVHRLRHARPAFVCS